MKKIVRLTESELNKIIKESVQRIILENNEAPDINDYLSSVEETKKQLRKFLPYLAFYSPEERAEIEAEMKKYGINPRDPEEYKEARAAM